MDQLGSPGLFYFLAFITLTLGYFGLYRAKVPAPEEMFRKLGI